MATKRKIRCDCGAYLKPKLTDFEGFAAEAMICPKCGFTTLTKEQAERYVQSRQLHRIIDAERRVIRVGNSMGITLPEQLKSYGLRIGKKVRTTALDADSFKVELIN
ncbi:hypothetical protein J4470_03120 [Candidatus Woesearchaeota archaeon]|nr:hypothetical protein [Candidatus Woesearchaeota archaeon]